MVLFTKENIDADKPIPVVILPLVKFIGGTTMHGRTGIIKGSREPEISVDVITTVGITVEEALDDIGMKTINVVIRIEFDGESSWVKLIG